MSENATKETTNAGRHGVEISREYDFPREAVFRMMTDPKTAPKFFSPEGAVKLLFEWDPRPGGAVRIHDRHSDGTNTKTSGTITEFVVPELFAFRSQTVIGPGPAPFEALQTVRFAALGPKRTRVTVHVKVLALGSFPGDVESLEGGFEGGWGQTLDMLERELR